MKITICLASKSKLEENDCNNTLPRGGVYWKIRPLQQFAPRGGEAREIARGQCRGLRGILRRIFQFIPSRGSVLLFFFQSGSVLEITPHKTWWYYINLIHSRSIKKNGKHSPQGPRDLPKLEGWEVQDPCWGKYWGPREASFQQVCAFGDYCVYSIREGSGYQIGLIFGDMPKGGAGGAHFQSKNLYCRFW